MKLASLAPCQKPARQQTDGHQCVGFKFKDRINGQVVELEKRDMTKREESHAGVAERNDTDYARVAQDGQIEREECEGLAAGPAHQQACATEVLHQRRVGRIGATCIRVDKRRRASLRLRLLYEAFQQPFELVRLAQAQCFLDRVVVRIHTFI